MLALRVRALLFERRVDERVLLEDADERLVVVEAVAGADDSLEFLNGSTRHATRGLKLFLTER